MNAKDFVDKYWVYAKQSEAKTKVPALVIMAQAALETGWGSTVVGNMMFGVKDSDGLNGNEQLLLTTEYIDNPDKKFPEVISKVKVVGKNLWKYKVRDWFRKYATPEESFTDHAKLLAYHPRYKTAMAFTNAPLDFATQIARAGYATDPDYASKLHSIIKTINKLVP